MTDMKRMKLPDMFHRWIIEWKPKNPTAADHTAGYLGLAIEAIHELFARVEALESKLDADPKDLEA